MRVCFVNTHDIIGGAERCSYDLLTGLRQRGHRVSLVVGRKLSQDPDVYPCQYPRWDWMPRAFLHQYLGVTDTTLVTPHRIIRKLEAFRVADVVNMHNMHGCYWNFWTLPTLARRGPVVLTLHDEWFLTGDCVYSQGCTAWQRSCGNCPQMALPFRPNLGGRDATRLNLWLKRRAARLSPVDRIVLVTPSEWLAHRVRQAPHLSGFRLEVIPNGIDIREFCPQDRATAKAKFNLPQDRFCFLIFANNLFDPRKGIELLVRSVKRYGLPENTCLLMVGNGSEKAAARLKGLPVQSHPYIGNRAEVAECLSAADCMLLLSESDNLPYTGIEAAGCGCPVLARQVGGIPEIVREGESGFLLAACPSEDEVFAKMQQVSRLTNSERRCVGEKARQIAMTRFSMRSFLAAYESLFAELAPPGTQQNSLVV